MTQFDASLIVSDDPTPLPTKVELHERNLTLTSGDQPIGTWSLDQVELNRVLGGFRFEVDGETVTLKIPQADTFADELHEIMSSAPKGKKRMKAATTTKAAKTPKATKAKAAPTAVDTAAGPGPQANGVSTLDIRLEAAQKRFGKYLPNWLFTKGGLIVTGVSLLLMLIFRQLFSAIFLIIAAIGLTASAVALVDQVIAVRMFRGKITAIQGLTGSLTIGLLGLLLGGI